MSLNFNKNDTHKDFKKALMKALEDSIEFNDLYFPQNNFNEIYISFNNSRYNLKIDIVTKQIVKVSKVV